MPGLQLYHKLEEDEHDKPGRRAVPVVSVNNYEPEVGSAWGSERVNDPRQKRVW